MIFCLRWLAISLLIMSCSRGNLVLIKSVESEIGAFNKKKFLNQRELNPEVRTYRLEGEVEIEYDSLCRRSDSLFFRGELITVKKDIGSLELSMERHRNSGAVGGYVGGMLAGVLVAAAASDPLCGIDGEESVCISDEGLCKIGIGIFSPVIFGIVGVVVGPKFSYNEMEFEKFNECVVGTGLLVVL